MPDAEQTGDELRGRLRGLARGAEQTAAPGLGDVRRRRALRQRNASVATAAAVVAVVGATALILQPFGDDPSVQPLGPGLSSSRSAAVPSTTTPTTGPSGQTSASASTTSPATSTTTDTSAPPVEPPATIRTLDLDSLVTPAELTAAGVPVGSADPGGSGQPTLPVMCAVTTWQEQYSDPGDVVDGSYSLGESTLLIHLLGYDDAIAANAALVKLKEDARACPTVNEFANIEVTAVGVAVGEEFVTFRIDSESGADGSIRPIWVTVARLGNVLVEAAVTEDAVGSDDSDNQQQTRDAAQANVDHLLAV